MHTKILTSYDEQWEMVQSIESKYFKFFDSDMIGCRTFIVAYEGNSVVGLAAITETTVWNNNSVGVGYISTHRKHRNKGVAKLLVKSLFKYAADTERDISNTPYEPDGELYLRHVMHRMVTEFPNVKLWERE